MVFKLPDPDAHARALALDGAHLFDPCGKGRPFKEWVVVPCERTRTSGKSFAAARAQARWLNQQPASSSRKTHAFRPDSSTRSK